ncbi:MAG: 1,4-alpha-glucan branching protein GlgB [Isosphaeraceae bacterium]
MIAHPISDFDLHLFAEGTHSRLYEKLGAHPSRSAGGSQAATRFVVWAPRACRVSVVGDFNRWDPNANPLRSIGESGVWHAEVGGVGPGARYKYEILPVKGATPLLKSDPFAFHCELRPGNSSIVADLDGYTWDDQAWMTRRGEANRPDRGIAIYEVHLGSWMRVPEQENRWLNYRELAPRLADYALEMGYTHVELMPIAEYPLDASWGYQTTGYFAPTSRYGSPHDFMAMIDHLHQRGLAVILDWVAAGFPADPHGLASFDGAPLFEDPDPLRGVNPEWGTLVFHYGRPEIVSFLTSSARFWLDRYHVDGLRIDAIAAMTRLDFGRRDGRWRPNRLGGHENLEAIQFLRAFNDMIHGEFPGAITVVTDSSAFLGLTRSSNERGLGFDYKWDVGWMHDTIHGYLMLAPERRNRAHDKLTFRMLYAYEEDHILVLSHDEVDPGRPSLLARMPGDDWQKFATLRLLLGYMYAMPGKKLIFMGTDFGQWNPWDPEGSIDWHLLDDPRHVGLKRWTRDLNTFYRGEPSMHQFDHSPEGFRWIDCGDAEQSVLCMLRRGATVGDETLLVANFTPIPRHNYRVGIPVKGRWDEVLNSDAALYGGSSHGNMGGVESTPIASHGQRQSLLLVLPPLGIVAFRRRPIPPEPA